MSCRKLLGRILEVRVLDDDEIAADRARTRVRSAAPLPRFSGCSRSVNPSSRWSRVRMSRVPSVEQSSTTMSWVRSGTASTRRMISSIVAGLVERRHDDRQQRIASACLEASTSVLAPVPTESPADGSSASARRRRRSCRGRAAAAVQPRSSRIRSADAKSTAGSPGRRGADRLRNRPARDALHRRDHVAHRRGPFGADVVGRRRPARLEPPQRAHVRVGQIGDVNVVAQAGAVRRRIVLAEDLDRRDRRRPPRTPAESRGSPANDLRQARRPDRRRPR